MRSRVVTLVLVGLLAAGCYAFQEGREQSTTFTSPLTPDELRARSVAWLERMGYRILRDEPALVRAENGRLTADPPQYDILSVELETIREGTRVRVHGLTEDVTSGGGRRQAGQISSAASGDVGRLVEELMRGTRPL
jgi:hypothetical protein